MLAEANNPSSLRAVVHDGRIEPLEPLNLPEGTQVIVLSIGGDDTEFWKQASAASLDAIWGNAEDDVYADLLKE